MYISLTLTQYLQHLLKLKNGKGGVTVYTVYYHQRAGKFSWLCFKRIQNSKD